MTALDFVHPKLSHKVPIASITTMIFMFPEFHELMYPLECRPVHYYKEHNIHSSALGKPKDRDTI